LFLSFLPRRRPTSTLFPYTTLFRSVAPQEPLCRDPVEAQDRLRKLAEQTRVGIRFFGLPPERLLDVGQVERGVAPLPREQPHHRDRKSTRLNSSHVAISYAVFCLKK